MPDKPACSHLDSIRQVTPSAQGCEECLKSGDTWVHLRLCRACGHVGCCDSSRNRHATKHFHATGHPIVQSFEPGEDWLWCYVDKVLMEPAEIGEPALAGAGASHGAGRHGAAERRP